MDAEKIQSDIDALLTYMNDDMENLGETIKTVSFGFDMDQNDRIAIDERLHWSEEYLFKIINICHPVLFYVRTMEILNMYP
jgi:hypothetical protein